MPHRPRAPETPVEPADRSRRRLLGRASALPALALGSGLAGRAAAQSGNLPPATPQWMKEPGAPFLSPAYGAPSPFEKEGRGARAAGRTQPLSHG